MTEEHAMCELVGGPHDGTRLSLDVLQRRFSGAPDPNPPAELEVGMFSSAQPRRRDDSAAPEFDPVPHPPISIYRRVNVEATRFVYAGQKPCRHYPQT